MARMLPAIAGDAFVPRLASFYGGLCLAMGVLLPFLSVWFAAKGLNASEIGFILAAPIVARIVAVPIVTGLADRFSALRAVIIVTALATTASYALVGFADGFWPILFAVALASAAFASLLPLTDTYALQGLGRRGRAYGPVRLWGSAAFIVGNIATGLVFDHISALHLIWVVVGAFALAAAVAFALPPLDADAAEARPRRSARVLLRSPGFLVVIVGASLVQASHGLYYGFSTLAWTAAGLSGSLIGFLWGLGTFSEIFLFALSGRLPPVFGPTMLLILGAAGGALRWTIMAFDPPVAALPLLQCLHAVSFGATHLGAVFYIARAAPKELAATAQGYLSIGIGVATSGAVALAGVMFGAFGTSAYLFMGAMAFAGGGFAFIAHRLRHGESPA